LYGTALFFPTTYTDLTSKCRILSLRSVFSFVVASALTIVNFKIAMQHFKVQLVLFGNTGNMPNRFLMEWNKLKKIVCKIKMYLFYNLQVMPKLFLD